MSLGLSDFRLFASSRLGASLSSLTRRTSHGPSTPRRLLALAAALLLTGCATTPPASFYVLTAAVPPDGAEITGGRPAIGLGPFELPEYLDRPQLVARTAPTELAIDELHRWGGSLQEDFLRVLGQNLAHELGTSRVLLAPADRRFPLDFRVIGDVMAFEGRPGGEAVLEVRWAVIDPYREEALSVRERRYRQPLSGEAPAVLVVAMSDLLAAFSRGLAADIRRLPRPVPPVEEPLPPL